MNARQLADRIGNIDGSLVDSASGRPKRRRLWPRLTAVAAALAIVAGLAVYLTGRTAPARASDLMEGYKAKISADPAALTDSESSAIAQLGIELLRSAPGEVSDLVSPVSAASALGMTALGARGQTLEEMSAVLGADPETLAEFLLAYRNAAGEDVHMANSVWFRDDPDLKVEPDFLQSNADYYSAGAYKAAFDDKTVEDINSWAKAHTGGMIDDLLDEIPDSAVMYLVNALSFEAEWSSPYELSTQVSSAGFTTESGDKRSVEMMYGELEDYFSDELSQGLIKHYKNGFAFAAILPNKGVTVDEYLSALTGEGLRSLLSSAVSARGDTAIPKFTLECEYELSDTLSELGMPTAFSGAADFTGIGVGRNNTPLFISRVVHKTFIDVAEKGTRAGALTSVELGNGDAPNADTKSVILNRPFIFMIVDTATLTPLFLGTVRNIGAVNKS